MGRALCAEQGVGERCRFLFWCDPKTGLLYWRQMLEGFFESAAYRHADAETQRKMLDARRATRHVGAGRKYGRVTIDGKHESSARVVWLLQRGVLPDGKLGRRDGDHLNDRFDNLFEIREKPRPGGRKRPLGVARLGDAWQAYATTPAGRRKNLGTYATEEGAVAARRLYDAGGWDDRKLSPKRQGVRAVGDKWIVHVRNADGQIDLVGKFDAKYAADDALWVAQRAVKQVLRERKAATWLSVAEVDDDVSDLV